MIITKELEFQIEQLLSQNRKVEAIKLVIDETHCGLKNAKDYIDNFIAGKIITNKEPASVTDIDAELLNLLARGEKLAAVKRYKEATGLGLADSKNYVDNLLERGFSVAQDPLISQNRSSSSQKRNTQIDDLVRDQNKNKSGCFIATVCYGDYNATEVLILRQFRDERLMKSFAGRSFVKFYYTVSPFIAKQINKSDGLKRLIRSYVLNPLVRWLSQLSKSL